ncbi:MAG: TIM barrel protein [Candidatus Hodarchaeales archaeon]
MFKTGLTIQKLDNIQPSSFVKIANVMKLEHIEFDMTVFDDIENVLKIIKTKQTAIHAPYFDDYGFDLSSNENIIDSFVDNILTYQKDLNIIGVVVHPPNDPKRNYDLFYERLNKIPCNIFLENMPEQSWEEFRSFFDETQAHVNRDMKICFDIPHSYVTNGTDYLNLPDFVLELLKQNTGYIHISGGTKSEDTHYALLTEGDMPLKPVKNFLRSIFRGTVTMELAPRTLDDIDKVLRSYIIMLGISKHRLHQLEIMLKRPFIVRKIKQLDFSSHELFVKKKNKQEN